jgi:hypothetical protein
LELSRIPDTDLVWPEGRIHKNGSNRIFEGEADVDAF